MTWLVTPMGNALADPSEQDSVGKIMTRSMDRPMEIVRQAKSDLAIEGAAGTITSLSVYLDLETRAAGAVKAYLISPLGTKVMLLDGGRRDAVTMGGIEGWFGADGITPTQSLKTMIGEPLNGSWTLAVETDVPSRLVRWSINSRLEMDNSNLGTATFSMYSKDDGGGHERGETSGCDCRVGAATPPVATLLMLVIGLLLWRRRTPK